MSAGPATCFQLAAGQGREVARVWVWEKMLPGVSPCSWAGSWTIRGSRKKKMQRGSDVVTMSNGQALGEREG